MIVTRSCKIKIYGNHGKLEVARYTYQRFLFYTQVFITQLFYNRHVTFFSTKGLGQLANKAQHKAQGILRAALASKSATGNKLSCPEISNVGCPAKIEHTKNSSFDFWISVENQFTKRTVKLPAKSHKNLNTFLRTNWELNPVCELFKDKNGLWYARVFVQKEQLEAKAEQQFIGCDVGITHTVSRSDGYLGKNTWKIVLASKLKDAERRRQGHVYSVPKTSLKQQLDIEVKRVLTRCKSLGRSLAVEDPKRLMHLRSGKLHGWARCYFANRAVTVGEEMGVFVRCINPYKTSQTCSRCGNCDKLSRVKSVFKCTACGNRTHADINAARVIALKGAAFSGAA